MNALQYMKNVGKSLGYATIDVAKSYNYSSVALADSAKDLGVDLYQSIKDFKESTFVNRSEKSFIGQLKDSVKDVKTSIFQDLKTGNWYNQQRIKKIDSEMTNDFLGGDFSFDFDDDFGDFEFEDDNDGTSSVIKQQISNEQKTTQSIINSMDAVGAKTSGAISMASVRSADYIVTSQKESSKAIYAITNRGFNQVSTGLAAINASLNNLAQIGQPLTAHMQNSTLFYSKSTEYQQESIKLLKQLVENTSSKSAGVDARKGPKYTIDDVLYDGSLDFKAYGAMLKDSAKDVTSMITSLIDMMGGISGIGKDLSKSPLSSLVKGGVDLLIPKMLKNTMNEFNNSMENFFAAGMEKLRNKSFEGPLGSLFDLFKDKLLPSSGYKNTIDPSRYNQGKVDWDGQSRKAIMDVIPFQLAHIISALNGKDPEIFDYKSGKWKTVKKIQSEFDNEKKRYADNVGGDYIYNAKKTVRDLSINKKISDKERDQIIKEIEAYNTYAFHSNDSDFMNIDNDNFNYKKYGMSKETWEFMRQYNKSLSGVNKKSNRMNYAGEVTRGRSSFGNMRRQQEADGSNIYSVLYNESNSINETEKTRTLLGVDEFNNDIFYYLQGIFLATTHVSDNLNNFVSGGKKIKGTSVQRNGKTAPIRTLIARPTENDKFNINEKISPSDTVVRSINASDIDFSTRKSLEAKNMNNLPKELADYIEAKKKSAETGEEIDETKYSKDKQKELEEQLKLYEGYDKFLKKIDKFKRTNPVIKKVGDAVGKLFHVPAEALTELINSAQVSMERVIFGSNASVDEKGLSQTLSDGFKNLFEGLKEKIDSLFPGASDLAKKGFDKFFGEKGEDGKRTGGLASGLFNSTVGELKNAGKWVKGIFTGNAASGRKVTKTGLVAVSEGEMIVPAEFNPFYNKTINKKSQIRNEYASIRNFYGNYADGTVKIDPNEDVPIDEDGNIDSDNEGTGQTKKMGGILGFLKDALMQGGQYLGHGILESVKGLLPDGKNNEKEKSNISKIASAALEDIGDSKGAAAAGAIIGGGVSLLTGALVGPILGAGIGAATGLIIRSDKVKNVLFGDIDEDGDHKGGVLNKQISNFLTKNIPGMAKGGTVGAAAGLFMGSPVLGAVLGSTVGYISSSENAKKTIFGEKDEDGNRRGGLISKELQDTIKKRMPGISAGAIAGLVAGPFGLAGNLVVGSALGYASSSDKFKNWLFGDPDDEGKRKGGFIGLLKDNLINPLVGIFDKLGEEIKVHVRNTFNNVGKSVRNFILKRMGGKIGSKFKSGATKVLDKVTGGSVRGVGNILKGADNALKNRALKKGYSIKDRSKGRNLTASERSEMRGENDKSTFGQIDQLLSQFNSQEELEEFQSLAKSMIDPTKEFDNRIIKSRGASKRMLSDISDQEAANKVYKYIKKKEFDKAEMELDNINIDMDLKSRIGKEIQIQRDSYENRDLAKNDTHAAKNKILQNSKFKELLGMDSLNDNQLRSILDLAKDEKSRFKEEGTPDHAVTETIPNLLKDIRDILSGKNTSSDDSGIANGDTKQDDEGNVMVYTNGQWEHDLSDSATRENINKKNRVMEALVGIPVIGTGIQKMGTGIQKMSGLFSSFGEKLFGKGEKKGLFPKLFGFLNGEDGPLSWLTSLFTGTKVGTVTKSLMSKITLKSVFANIVGPALLIGGFAGKFDNLASKLFGFGQKNSDIQTSTFTDPNGNKVIGTYDKESKMYIDDQGNKYSPDQGSDINIRKGDTATFSEKLTGNTVRGLLTNKKSVASTILGRTAVGKTIGRGIKTYASNITKVGLEGIEGSAALLTIGDSVTSGIGKVLRGLKNIPVLKNLDIDGLIAKLSTKVTNVITSSGAQKLAQFASNAVLWAKIAFVVIDFTSGYEDAATTMKIKSPTVGDRIIAGLLRALKNCIPILGTLIPDDVLVDIFVEFVAPLLGMNIEEFKQERAEVQAEVDAYNAQHGTNMDWQKYNKTVRQDYTWTERIGNAASSTVADTKQKWNNMKTGISEKGIGGYVKDSVSTMRDTFIESYENNGGGLAGTTSAIGDVMQSILPGIFGDIAKANADIGSFAAKGDLKSLWGVSLPDFSTDGDPVRAQVGIFSKIVGQIPLITTKVMSTPIAAVSWTGHKVASLFGVVKDKVVKAFTDVATNFVSLQNISKTGDISRLMSSEVQATDDEGNPLGGVMKGVNFAQKIMLFVPTVFSWVGNKIKSTVSNLIDGVKTNISYIGRQEQLGEQLIYSQDSLSNFMSIEDPPDSPISGIVKSIAFISRILSIVPCTIKRVGKNIAEIFNNIKDKITTSVSAVTTNYTTLQDFSKQGKIGELWSSPVSATDDEGNPLGGIMKAVNFVQKITLTVPTIFHMVGNKVADFFNGVKEKVSASVSSIATNYISLQNLAKEGKVGELISANVDKDDPENPIGGFMKTVNFVQKICLFPSALFHLVGGKISDGISNLIDNTKSNFNTVQDGIGELNSFAKEGNLSDIWKKKLDLKSPDPLKAISGGIFNISKFFYSIVAIIKKISGPIKDAIDNVTGWVGDAKDWVGDRVDDVAQGATNVKNTVVGGVKKAANTVGGWAEDAWSGFTNWISGGGSGFVSQIDPRYANKGIGNSTVGELGCGPATAVMALNQAGKHTSMDNAISSAQHYQTGSGTDLAYFKEYFNKNGADASYYDGTSAAGKFNLYNSIRSGQPTILMGSDRNNSNKAASPFGPNNHYVVASGMDRNGNIIVNDPESTRGGIKYSSSILNNVKVGVGVSGGGSFIRRRFGLSAGATSYPHTLRVDDTTKAVWSFFRSRGYSEAATAGIMGNLQQESGIDPTRHQVGGSAKGICQWEEPRFGAMVKYAASKGKDWTDLNSQLEYMHQEIQGLSYWFKTKANTTVQGFMNSTDVTKATYDFEVSFERAGKPNFQQRYKYSVYYYQQFSGKQYNYDSAVGAALAGSSPSGSVESSFAESSPSGSYSTTTNAVESSVKGFGILSTINSAFGKIGELFTGSSSSDSGATNDVTNSYAADGYGYSDSSTDSAISPSFIDSSTKQVADPTGINFSGNSPVELMKSILGKIKYDMSGPRNPEKGSADCSSTVNWAIKKAGGPDIGGNTSAQYNNPNLKTVWYGNGSVANSLPSNIKENDILFFSRPNSGYTVGRQDRVGHIELYAGNGQMIGHGSDMGPKLQKVPLGMGKNGGLIKVSRVAAGGSGLLDLNNSAAGSGLMLLNNSSKNKNPFVDNGRIIYNNSVSYSKRSAGASAIPTDGVTKSAVISNTKSGITKETAALLKVIITLIESLVSNTNRIDNIYDVLVNYCQSNLAQQGTEAVAAVQALQQGSSSNDSVESSLSSLKETVDSILAS